MSMRILPFKQDVTVFDRPANRHHFRPPFIGGTGSGKTNRIFLPLLSNLIKTRAQQSEVEKLGILLLDPKLSFASRAVDLLLDAGMRNEIGFPSDSNYFSINPLRSGLGGQKLAEFLVKSRFAGVPMTQSAGAAYYQSRATPATLVLVVASVDGELDQPMTSTSSWPAISRPLIFDNLVLNNALNARTPNTADDTALDQSNPAPIVSSTDVVSRDVNGVSSPFSFTACVQFDSSGEGVVALNTPARYIKLAVDQPFPANGKNPFIVRISGINGIATILRKEDGIQ